MDDTIGTIEGHDAAFWWRVAFILALRIGYPRGEAVHELRRLAAQARVARRTEDAARLRAALELIEEAQIEQLAAAEPYVPSEPAAVPAKAVA